jgi:O-antigen ligase
LLGDIAFGTFVSGFTGMSFNLANLVVLAFPALIVLTYRLTETRWYLSFPVIVSFGVVRASSSDAGRGALILAVLAFAVLSGWAYRSEVRSIVRTRILHRASSVCCISAILAGLPLLFYPSSKSGDTSTTGIRDATDPAGGSSAGGGGPSTGGPAPVADVALANRLLEQITTVSVPFFDLSNLGVRLQQYLVGLVITARYPIFGLGGMNFVLVAERYGIDPRAGESLPLPIHNIYVTLLAETGIVGFLLYVGTLCLVLLYGFRLLQSTKTDRLLVAGVMAGLIGSLGFGFWDHLQLYHATGFFPLWILAGSLVGEYQRVARDSTASSTT